MTLPNRATPDQAITSLTPEQLAAMYPEPDWLQQGAAWPPADIKEHIDTCEANYRLFKCRLAEAFPEQYQRLQEAEPTRAPTTYEQEINLFHALTMLWRALLTAEPPQFGAGKPGSPEAKAVERIARQTGLVSKIKRAVIDQSSKADAVLVVGHDPRNGKVTIDLQPPERWYPFVDPGNIGHKLADVLFYEEKVRERSGAELRYLNAAIHYPGLVKHRRFQIKDGKLVRVDAIRRPVDPESGALVPENQETSIPVSLVHVGTNIGTSSDVTGMSDYDAIETVVPELSIRASQWGKLFDKFTDPTAYGPPLQAEENPTTGAMELKFRGRYIEVSQGEQAPGYAVWDPQLAGAFNAWDKLMDVYFMATGSNAAAFEVGDKEGSAPSGTSLRLKMARPLQVAADKAQELDPAVTGALYAAQLLEVALGLVPDGAAYTPAEPRVDWRDGLPDDPKERAEIENVRTGGKATTSTLSAIKRLDGLSDEEAEDELARIQEDQAAGNPFIPSTDMNGPNGPQVLAEARRLMKDNPDLTEDDALQQAAENLKKGGGQNG